MKVAVTGASGFIGRHVVAELVRQDADVVAVARRTDVTWDGRVLPVTLDILEAPADVFDRLGRPDILIHLAWGGLPNYRSLHHFETELPAHYRFLKGMVEAGLTTLLVADTCFEYGMQSGCLGEDQPPRPDNPYGYAKDCLRQQLQFLQQTHPFALVWPRLFYLYGEGQASNSLYPQLRSAALRGEPVFNMSGGEQLRDYLPVGNVARYIVTLAMQRQEIGVVNLCSGQPISVRKLVEHWIADYGWNISLNLGHYPYPDYEPLAFWGNDRKLSNLLGRV